jgi:hypothetical protein
VRPILALEHDVIVATSQCVGYERLCGVYFLILNGSIVYVGQTVDLWHRLIGHRSRRGVRFDRVAWIAVPEPYLDMVESWYFHRFKPSCGQKTPISDIKLLTSMIGRSKASLFLTEPNDKLTALPPEMSKLMAAEIKVDLL